MDRRLVLIGALTVVTALGAAAQTAGGLFLAGEVGIGIETDDLVDGSALGGSLGYRFPGGLLLVGSYLFAGTDFYYFEADSGWQQAPSWSEVPSGGSRRGDWIFYRQRHVVGMSAGLSGRVGPVGVFGTGGLMLNVVSLSDAEDYYPEFTEAAEESSIAGGRTLTTTTVRAGLVYPARGSFAGTLSWMVNFDRIADAATPSYFQRNSLVVIGVSIQAGGGGRG
ncbi:MAG: hypothetical protein WD492_09990 [Alkalispirochaeta sp.]